MHSAHHKAAPNVPAPVSTKLKTAIATRHFEWDCLLYLFLLPFRDPVRPAYTLTCTMLHQSVMSHRRYKKNFFKKCNPPGRSVIVPSDSFFPFSKGELDTKNQRQYRNVPGNMMNNTRGAIRVTPLIMATSVWLQKPFSTNKCGERCTSGYV